METTHHFRDPLLLKSGRAVMLLSPAGLLYKGWPLFGTGSPLRSLDITLPRAADRLALKWTAPVWHPKASESFAQQYFRELNQLSASILQLR